MGYLLTKRVTFKKRVCLMLIILLLSALNLGCDPYYKDYPYKTGSTWICTNPSIVLSYEINNNGTMIQEELLVWEDATIEMDILFQADSYAAYPSNMPFYEKRLFSGSWRYNKGNLILEISEDFIFDYQFEELVFIMQTENAMP